MFSKKMRDGLIGGAALAIAGLMGNDASAAVKGVLVTNDFCKHPAPTLMLEMTRRSEGFDSLYYMRSNGKIESIKGEIEDLPKLEELLILSPNSKKVIGGLSLEDFTGAVASGFFGLAKLKKVKVITREEGSGEDTLIHKLADTMFATLEEVVGFDGIVHQVGRDPLGNTNISFTSNRFVSPDDNDEFQALKFNITQAWKTQTFKGPEGHITLPDFCAEGLSDDKKASELTIKSVFGLMSAVTEELFFPITAPDDWRMMISYPHFINLIRGGGGEITCLPGGYTHDTACKSE